MNSRTMLFVEMTNCKYPTKISFRKLAGIHGKNKGNGPFLFVLYTVGNKTQSDVNRRSVQTEICIYFSPNTYQFSTSAEQKCH